MTVSVLAWGNEVLIAVLAGLAASVAITVVLTAASSIQRRRVIALGHASISGQKLIDAAGAVAGEKTELLRKIIASAVEDVATDQGLLSSLVRGSLFQLREDGRLGIPNGLSVNIRESTEESIAIRPGESGVGEAYALATPVVTIFDTPREDTTIASQEEREKVNPRVRWIISVPVASQVGPPPWILAVDGLDQTKTTEELTSSVKRLLYYSELLRLILLREEAR